MDIVDVPFIADLDETEPDKGPTPEPEKETKPEDTPDTAEAGPTPEPEAEGQDDDPEEWKNLVQSKFSNLKTEREVKSALAKSYFEQAKAASQGRRDEITSKIEALNARLDQLVESRQERREPEPSPEIEAIDEELRSLDQERKEAVSRRKEIEDGWAKREREIGRLEALAERADEIDRPAAQAKADRAISEHQALINEWKQLAKAHNAVVKQITGKLSERQRAERTLSEDRDRQRQAEKDREDWEDQTRERFYSHVTELVGTHKVTEEDSADFVRFVRGSVFMDLKSRPPDSPAVDLRRLADHYAKQWVGAVERAAKRIARQQTSPKTPAAPSPARPVQKPRETPTPQSREELERKYRAEMDEARQGLGEFFKKRAASARVT